MNILKVLMWIIFGAWVCFLGYCANGHNKYQPSHRGSNPSSALSADPQSLPPPALHTETEKEKEDGNIDGPKTYFVQEHGSMRGGGGSRIETPYEKLK